MLSGAIGGLAGALAMDILSRLWTGLREPSSAKPDVSLDEHRQLAEAQERRGRAADPDAVVSIAVADYLAHALGQTLPKEKRAFAGKAVHYSYGAAAGAIYGAGAELRPEVTAIHGAAFGLLLWLGEMFIAVPLLSTANRATKFGVAEHLFSGAEHAVFGLAVEGVRRKVSARLA
ncbi:MAG TPA: DUF1440 domain-containing protein [Bryobacteraceae bacterium]|nr:DUF1440 domain-containing protein [Bryobacteraceae bacterium]